MAHAHSDLIPPEKLAQIAERVAARGLAPEARRIGVPRSSLAAVLSRSARRGTAAHVAIAWERAEARRLRELVERLERAIGKRGIRTVARWAGLRVRELDVIRTGAETPSQHVARVDRALTDHGYPAQEAPKPQGQDVEIDPSA